MNDLLKYNYSISEEIARWSFEVFLDHNSNGKWWIAFTNPTAGPWKKITSKNDDGRLVEIYRFAREEDRPDIVAVSDDLKQILIIEAKDYAQKLLGNVQMEKSAKVIVDMESVLRDINIDVWEKRRNYKVTPGFLWFSESESKSLTEVDKVTTTFINIRNKLNKNMESANVDPINIVIRKTEQGLCPFIYSGVSPVSINLFKGKA